MFIAQRLYLLVLVGGCLLGPAWSSAKPNLLVNGNFDHPQGALHGWTYSYTDSDGSDSGNQQRVAITNDGPHANVLRLGGKLALTGGPETRIDSHPIPMPAGAKYQLTATARATGPNFSRILVEGYHWRPGIKPHPHPQLTELRKCYRFRPLYFGNAHSGPSSNIGTSWSEASQIFPEKELSPLAQKSFDKIQFLVVHVLSCWDVMYWDEFYLYIDNIKLELLK